MHHPGAEIGENVFVKPIGVAEKHQRAESEAIGALRQLIDLALRNGFSATVIFNTAQQHIDRLAALSESRDSIGLYGRVTEMLLQKATVLAKAGVPIQTIVETIVPLILELQPRLQSSPAILPEAPFLNAMMELGYVPPTVHTVQHARTAK